MSEGRTAYVLEVRLNAAVPYHPLLLQVSGGDGVARDYDVRLTLNERPHVAARLVFTQGGSDASLGDKSAKFYMGDSSDSLPVSRGVVYLDTSFEDYGYFLGLEVQMDSSIWEVPFLLFRHYHQVFTLQ